MKPDWILPDHGASDMGAGIYWVLGERNGSFKRRWRNREGLRHDRTAPVHTEVLRNTSAACGSRKTKQAVGAGGRGMGLSGHAPDNRKRAVISKSK